MLIVRVGSADDKRRVFGHDDSAWSVTYPPNGWRCRCRAQPLTAAVRREGYTVQTGDGHIQQVDVPYHEQSAARGGGKSRRLARRRALSLGFTDDQPM
ncbi:MAG: hypothetical protein LBI59_11095 [Candidatus Accumulibacter sp.]|nr:hypothetical protein [Accumulibacter sp.]